jgi:hypothetical protein
MLRRLPLLLVPLALMAVGCTTSTTQSGISNSINPRSTVTRQDAQALDRKREERRELAKILLERAEQRSKTQQPSMWRPLGLPEDGTAAPLEPVKILGQPWTALERVLSPGASPASSTATISR